MAVCFLRYPTPSVLGFGSVLRHEPMTVVIYETPTGESDTDQLRCADWHTESEDGYTTCINDDGSKTHIPTERVVRVES